MEILGLFGIRRPSRMSVEIDAAVKEWQLRHAEATECLVCSALARGMAPEDIEIVREQRGDELVVFIRPREQP